MITNETHLNEINSPKQTIKARVELYKGSTLEKICNCGNLLNEFTVERVGEGKFFGFGICKKLKVSLIDMDRELNLTTEHSIEAAYGVKGEFVYPYPKFFVDTVERNETNNLITLTAFDALYRANNHTVSELILPGAYSLRTFVAACAQLLEIPLVIEEEANASFDMIYDEINFDGSESIREALNRVAEATQTIYFMDNHWDLRFKRLDRSGEAVYKIDRDRYYEMTNLGEQVLTNIVHTTELEDSVASVGEEGTVTQFIRDNPFWELRTDIGALIDAAQDVVGGMSIGQFECDWIGNYLLEIGDKIELVNEDGSISTTYLLDDTITYDGTLSQHTRWVYDDNSSETANNPSTLGDALNKTFARVDKVNKRIDLVVSNTEANSAVISALQINTDSIAASVSKIETGTQESINEINSELDALNKQASLTLTEEQVRIAIETEMANGASKVVTSTGFTFDDEGLSVSKEGSEMTTTISEDGMAVFRESEQVLTANNAGVNAANLHATTFLIIGSNSRFESYGNRTGCFWIGE